MADLMRLAVSVAVIAGAKEIFCWGKKFVATTTVKDIVDETIEKAAARTDGILTVIGVRCFSSEAAMADRGGTELDIADLDDTTASDLHDTFGRWLKVRGRRAIVRAV